MSEPDALAWSAGTIVSTVARSVRRPTPISTP